MRLAGAVKVFQIVSVALILILGTAAASKKPKKEVVSKPADPDVAETPDSDVADDDSDLAAAPVSSPEAQGAVEPSKASAERFLQLNLVNWQYLLSNKELKTTTVSKEPSKVISYGVNRTDILELAFYGPSYFLLANVGAGFDYDLTLGWRKQPWGIGLEWGQFSTSTDTTTVNAFAVKFSDSVISLDNDLF